jgi:TusA-related sulfurtransferase
MAETTPKTIEIDVCGQICPSSLLTTLREVNNHKQQLRSGDISLQVLTDNHDSTNRVCEAVANMGYLVKVEDQNKHYRISISKTP